MRTKCAVNANIKSRRIKRCAFQPVEYPAHFSLLNTLRILSAHLMRILVTRVEPLWISAPGYDLLWKFPPLPSTPCENIRPYLCPLLVKISTPAFDRPLVKISASAFNLLWNIHPYLWPPRPCENIRRFFRPPVKKSAPTYGPLWIYPPLPSTRCENIRPWFPPPV